MKKFVIAALGAALLLVGTAAPAEAKTPVQTLHTGSRSTAVIKPITPAVPAGALVFGRVISVKQGKKLIAVNKKKLRVKRGKYKVLSSVVYAPRVTRTVTDYQTVEAARITSIDIVSDRADFNDGGGVVTDWLSGQVTFGYHGMCALDSSLLAIGASGAGTFACSWQSDEYVFVDFPPGTDRTTALLSDTLYGVGDLVYYPEVPDRPVTRTETTWGSVTVKSKVRTVKVVR